MPQRNFIRILIIILVVTSSAVVQAGDTVGLRVTWAENGSLMLWTAGDRAPQLLTTDSAIRPFLSPDGQHIAFARGDGVLATSLWIIQADGQNAREVVGTAQLTDGEQAYIAQVAWFDSTTLYFNTLRQTAIQLQPQNDLWRADITTGEVRQILGEGEGGSFSISPSREQIALIYPGAYGEPTGRIRLLDPDTLTWADKLEFVGVSTGAEYPFYPEVFWMDNSSTLLTAIPDKDLVYDDINSPQTVLWRVPAEGESQPIGTVPASFFGQPRWSSDGASVAYLQRIGEPTSNQFALMLADQNGQGAVEYDSGEAGRIGQPMWIPGAGQFIYGKDEPGSFYLGAKGEQLQPLGHSLYNLQFVDSTTYIYAIPTATGLELRTTKQGETDSTLIAPLQSNGFVYSARIITA